jgi:1-acyl-sn-glycerol-3-phosphate acyltransferase
LSAATSATDKRSLADMATATRLVFLVMALAAFILAFGPPLMIAQSLALRFGRRFPVYFQRLLCLGLGVRVRRHGSFSAAPRQLIVANHVSWLDIPVLGSLEPMAFLAKKEIADSVFARKLVALQGVVYVNRRRPSCIPLVNARMVETMRSGSAVVLFAEATTGDGNRLLRFRSSHFEAVRLAACLDKGGPVVVQPVYLNYSGVVGLPIARWERPRIAWYGDTPFMPHFFQYARGGGVICDVYCGKPIRILRQMDRKAVARLTEAAVRELAAKARANSVAISRCGKTPT